GGTGASGGGGAAYTRPGGVPARGGPATIGNAYRGQQNPARWGRVPGPAGQSASATRVGNDYYASRDGNVYRNTGGGWQHYDNGGGGKPRGPPPSHGRRCHRRAAA